MACGSSLLEDEPQSLRKERASPQAEAEEKKSSKSIDAQLEAIQLNKSKGKQQPFYRPLTDSVQKGTVTQARRSIDRVEEEKKSSSSASLNEEERREIAQYQELQESLKTLKDQVGQPSVELRTKSPGSDNSKKSGKALGQNYSVSSEEDKNYDDG